MRRGDEGHEVLVAGEVFRQEHEVEGLAVTFDSRVALEAVRARDVRLGADDRPNAGLARLHVEVDRAVERAVIGERERGHLELFGARDEVADTREPVEQAVLAMRVEVDELLDGRTLSDRSQEARRQRSV